MYSAYNLNKQGDNIQPWRIPFPIWNQSIFPCPVLSSTIYLEPTVCRLWNGDHYLQGWDSVVENLPANVGDARDVDSVPGWGRPPGGGNGNPHGQRSLEDCSPWGCKESDTTKQLSMCMHVQHTHTHTHTHTFRGEMGWSWKLIAPLKSNGFIQGVDSYKHTPIYFLSWWWGDKGKKLLFSASSFNSLPPFPMPFIRPSISESVSLFPDCPTLKSVQTPSKVLIQAWSCYLFRDEFGRFISWGGFCDP